jgi:bifunctional ADP-heptose synthase (sugar kinase/adenylyltransferase)
MVLLALRVVDAVVIFEEPTAGPLLDRLRPAVYVKGGDYSLAGSGSGIALPEESIVRAYGGEIYLLPYLPGRSTSALFEKIRGTA